MSRNVTTAAALVDLVAVTLTGCDPRPSLPFSGEDSTGTSKAMVVGVEVTSDAAPAASARVEVDATEDPQRVDTSDMPLPYEKTVEVALDAPFPLTGTSVEATAGAEAIGIAGRISLDGDVIAAPRAEGADATIACERELRVGPQ